MKNLLLAVSLLVAALVVPSRAAARPPNVIVIFVDDMGYADIGPFGAKVATPNLDRMAREGRRFTNFHVSSAVCSASRAALLTGCYHSRVGIHGALGPGSKTGLDPSETTLAELMKQKGYATGMAGKWHLGDAKRWLPTAQGFDEWLGLPYSNDMWPLHPESPKGYPDLPMFDGDRIVGPAMTHADQEQLTTRYTERAVSFIERTKDRPFFFYLAHNMPHVPLHVSSKFAGRSGAGLYGDVVQEIDWSVGQVLDALRRTGIDQDTWVVFTSDNGPWLSYGDHAGSAGPLREGKGTSWEGGTRVPCLMRWPGKIPAGSDCASMMMTLDLFPTIAARIGAQLPAAKIDGTDVWRDISGKSSKTRAKPRNYAWYYANNELQGVTDGRWKLMLSHGYRTLGDQPKATGGIPARYHQVKLEHPQLFDLASDIGEQTDVAAAHPDVVARLMKFAESMRADLGDSLTGTPPTRARGPGKL